jgi:hypothetical protein
MNWLSVQSQVWLLDTGRSARITGIFLMAALPGEDGREVAPENATANQRPLGPRVASFSGAPWMVINPGAPHVLVIALLSHCVRPLSANVRPRGWLLSRNVRPLMPLLSYPVD